MVLYCWTYWVVDLWFKEHAIVAVIFIVEQIGVPTENHQPVASHRQHSDNRMHIA